MAEGFFDIHQKLATQRTSAKSRGGNPAPPGPEVKAMSVSQFTAAISKVITSGFPMPVNVRGEISNVRDKQASGHIYFTLKDDSANLNCVMWQDVASRLKFRLEDGAEMLATGNVSVYAAQGRYQLKVSSLVPIGQGAMELAFRQLRAKLEAEGLLATERKKPIPAYPQRIVMITSRSAAGFADILKVFRAFPWLKLMLYAVPVQGEESGIRIANAITHINKSVQKIGGADLILLARGGGSAEDLWSFNEESVARAIVASKIPVITGIGHEIDITIADLVADYHAHTPTEAARIITQNWRKVPEILEYAQTRVRRALRQTAQDARQQLNAIERHEFFRRPKDQIQSRRQKLDDLQGQLTLSISRQLRDANQRIFRQDARLRECHPKHQIALANQKLQNVSRRLGSSMALAIKSRQTRVAELDRHLQAISPEAVLKRGYTITTSKKTGQVIRVASGLREGDKLVTRFHDGEAESVVRDSRQLSLFD
jgi:exodeoxyribonuclease VII large subunit